MEQIAESHVSADNNVNVLDAIYMRRAVRQFTSQAVRPDTVEALINAAIQAPSAMNKQPWAFCVIQDAEVLHRMNESAKQLLKMSPAWKDNSEHAKAQIHEPEFDIFYGATTLIVICAEQDGFQPVGDCYLAGENLMLAATAFGLATCPIGFARDVLQTEAFRGDLDIPKRYTPVLPLIVGYPKTLPPKTPRNQQCGS